ncbi:MAG: hypothetical protein DRQ88_05855 [Epsilonproteobacteria bacterium]|nr:MAG: hypothetical protein DRQ89_11745 [Campylobacterota bacterium]RLA66552.1 MAG: hypothetical protein DRQ88_05855 [Campylobacterota bacterium]
MDLLESARQGSKPEEFYTVCPKCAENGKSPAYKLGINTKKGIFNCFRCNYKGRLSSLDASYEAPDVTLESLKERLNWGVKEAPICDLTDFTDSIQSSSEAHKYLANRGLSDADIRKFGIRVGKPYLKDGEKFKFWKDRVVFPFYHKDKCVYAVGRTFNGSKVKYLNYSGQRRNLLWGLNRVKSEPIILCEGIFSAIYAEKLTGVKAIALLGKKITLEQLSLLQGKATKIYLCLDADVTKKEKKDFLKTLIYSNFPVYDVELTVAYKDGKVLTDPNDFGKDFITFFKEAKKKTMNDLW